MTRRRSGRERAGERINKRRKRMRSGWRIYDEATGRGQRRSLRRRRGNRRGG